VLLASLSGLLLIVAMLATGVAVERTSRLAFGPHLAAGLCLTWVFLRTGLL
jgi:prepilin signal peptidase PulO-like enzyme (type II secretory pathway)